MPAFLPTGQSTGAGSVFQTEVTKTIAAGAANRWIPLPGWYYFLGPVGADIVAQIIDSTSAWTSVNTAGTAPGSGAPVYCDGQSYGLLNNGVGNETIRYIQVG